MKRTLMNKIICIVVAFTLTIPATASALKTLDNAGENNGIEETVPAELDYEVLSENEKLIYDYYKSIDGSNWGKWASFYPPAVADGNLVFATNPENQANNVGILAVSSAHVVTIDKVDNSWAPKYREFEDCYDSEDDYECYMVGIDQTVKQETAYNFNGINYKLVLLVRDNEHWNLGGVSGCPFELLKEKEDIYPVDAAMEDYAQRALTLCQPAKNGATPLGIGSGFISGSNYEPSTINVGNGYQCQNGTYGAVAFCTFIRKGTQGEIGNLGYSSEAIKACMMAVKMVGWWAALGHYRDTYGVDIYGGYDVAYSPNNTPVQSVENAYNNAICSYGAQSSSGQFFFTAYRGGSYQGSQGGGVLSQNYSNTLAGQGKTWQQIIHYFYDNSAYNNPNVGTVKIISTIH